MIPIVCTQCKGLGRVCLGDNRTKRIDRIETCTRCGGNGWEPEPNKKPTAPPPEGELPLV